MMLRATGSLLLILAGAGGGFAAAAHIRENERRVHSFAQLLVYLADLLDAQALAGPILLERAAHRADFAPFCPAGAQALSRLVPPPCLPKALRHELYETLCTAEESPRQTACAALRRLAALCEEHAALLAERSRAAWRLWPRLGGCLGAMTAILLW